LEILLPEIDSEIVHTLGWTYTRPVGRIVDLPPVTGRCSTTLNAGCGGDPNSQDGHNKGGSKMHVVDIGGGARVDN
jgi:hypothetical protein